MKSKFLFVFALPFLLGGSLLVKNNKTMTVEASESKGMSIVNDRIVYELDEVIESEVNTYTAWIKVPTSIPENTPVGVIIGNHHYDKCYDGSTNISIDANGHLRVNWGCKTYDHTFTSVDLRNGELTHVALVRDKDKGEFRYFVNGILKETVDASVPSNMCKSKYRIGMDQASWYIDYYDRLESPFLGEIKSVGLFENALSNTLVGAVKNSDYFTKNDFPGIITYLNFNNWGNEKTVKDMTGQLNAHVVSFNKEVPVDDNSEFDYSFIVVPDMQAMTYWEPSRFFAQSNWLVENKEQEKIKFVMYLGDMTESKFSKGGQDALNNDREWQDASSFIQMLDDEIPYTVILGNHDYDNWAQSSRASTQFNKYFNYDNYKDRSYFGGAFKEGIMDNTYSIINVMGIEYLIFSLEEGPRTKVLKWVDRIIEEHPDSRVLITTHSYLSPQNVIDNKDSAAGVPSKTIVYDDCNDGLDMWNKSFSKHANVLGIFSGHQCSDDIIYRTDKGIYGNTVHSFLVNFQGSVLTNRMNTVMRVRVNETKKTMSICAYWIDKDCCFNMQNQFIINFADEFNPNVGK